MSFSYDNELWNGHTAVTDRFEEGRRTMADMVKFMTERQQIEDTYLKNVQKFVSKLSGFCEQGTFGSAWNQVKATNEVHARERAELGNLLLNDFARPVESLRQELYMQKEALVTEFKNLARDMARNQGEFAKTKSAYLAASQNSENALFNYESARKNPGFPPKKLTALSALRDKLRAEAEAADEAYKAQVTEFSAFQEHYEKSMKRILVLFQKNEERRLVFLKETMQKYVSMHETFLEKQEKHNATLRNVIGAVDGVHDIQKFLTASSTGKQPDPLAEYEPYNSSMSLNLPDAPPPVAPTGTASSGRSGNRKKYALSLFAGRKKSTAGESSTPPPSSSPTSSSPSSGSGPLPPTSSGPPPTASLPPPGNPSPAGPPRGGVPMMGMPVAAFGPNGPGVPGMRGTGQHRGVPRGMVGRGAPRGGMRGRGGVPMRGRGMPMRGRGRPPSHGHAVGPGGSLPPGVLCVASAKFKYSAQDETELSMEVGDLINITKKEEGWWTGYITNPNESGMMPCNYVEVVQEPGPVAAASSPGLARRAAGPPPTAAIPPAKPQCLVTFNYSAAEEGELTISKGERLIVEEVFEGWMSATNATGEQGLIPINYTDFSP
mmetsp:Transcript_37431/g.94033  ORF Transcript_37431/g.94033 Transcript_37431/m.94033 type:complete len:605 (-) Transcript_37431:129-1943(-)|eukprot:CAMPEP_0177645998 /NCGR_PEP_ID=MMETSP0447-20121125/9543_1 /TAXON_ID=0 /ORGANISM="Stygamoeba regulata, Strain BSH-02190019" /LENGTH=604 /DNA_ID=CAMNT_0019148509 /DNA_START=248 /DNA_END=2062 /DNA_ORIENTATION=-